MNINTSNQQRFKNSDQFSSFQTNRREVINSSNYRDASQQPGINGDGGMEHNLVYRAFSFPDQVGFDELVTRKEVLHDLLREFKDKDGKIVFEPYKKQEYSKRLLLLQQQIDGLMRQNFMYSGKGTDGAVRTIDYLALINEKQNQVVQLQRKIANLEANLRMRDQRQSQLQSELERRFALIKSKNDQIERLRNSARSYADTGKSQPDLVNSLIKSLCSKLEDVARRGGSVTQMQAQVEGWIMGLPADSQLKRKLRAADESWLQGKYKKYVSYLTVEAGALLNNVTKMYTTQIDTLKSRGAQVDYDSRILEITSGKQKMPLNLLPTEQILMSSQVANRSVNNSNIGSITNIINSQSYVGGGYTGYMNGVRKVVEVPVQDSRTKALIHKLASEMRRLYTKYPKLATEISPQLSQYFSQQILDVIEVDELDRLVEIVKYQPQIVRVQNVYAYSSEKSRKVEFHLRVLIKALLQEMERMRLKTGVQPQIDEGVIGMIRNQIMDVVDVEDILRVYRVVPKIVEVQKVVEQVVQKIVPVPHFVTVESRQTDVVPLSKVEVVKNTVNVPLQVPRIQTLVHEKLINAPEYHERVVVSTALQQNRFETVTEVPTVRNVEKVLGLPQQVAKIVEVPGPEKIVALQKQIVKTLIEQKIVPIQKIVQKIKQVPQIIQKVVTVIQEVPKIIQVQKIVQKIVKVTQYVENQRVQNYVVQKPIEVQCYIEKIVPVQRIVERVVTVPEVVQKLVPVIKRQEVIKTVQVIKQVPIYKTEIKVVERIVQVPVDARTVEVAKPVDRIVEVPFIHQKVRVETEYRKEPVIEREQKIIRQPVHVEVPVVLIEQKILEVPKTEIKVLKQQIPRDIIKQKIVPVETVRQQLIPAPCIVEKVIQKIVEVPRVVEIEKIVQKIVPIPRVVEKIVEVQKIVEKIVERTIYQTDIKPVQYITQVPIEVEKLQTIEVPTYVVERVQVPQYIDRDRIIVNETKSESVRVEVVEQPPRVTIQRRQVPIEIVVEKLVPLKVEEHVYVELKEQLVVPVQVPVPTTLIQQKVVAVEHVIPVVQQVDRVRQKIVQITVEMPGRVEHKDRIVQKLFVEKDIKVVRDQIPYYNDKIIEVQRFSQKIVPVQRVIKQVMEVPYMVQKLVNQIIHLPEVKQIQRIVQVPVKTQQLITVDRVVPKIVTLNKAFAQIVDKLHQFPRLAEEMKKVNAQIETIVPEKHSGVDIRQAEVYVQKAVIEQKIKQVDKFVNVVNESLKVVDRIIEKPMQPIIITEQKILEVPVIVEKLAERIVIMPQVVEVLKYIHEITDNQSLGVALTGDMGIQQAEYQRLGKSVNGQLAKLRAILLDLKRNPQYKGQITVIDNFLAQFNKFLAYPRIRQVMTQKVVQSVVEKDKIVRVPTRSSDDERRGLASAVLIDKLLMEVRKLKQSNSNSQYRIDQDLVQIFGQQLQPVSSKYGNNYNQLLDQYSKSIFSRFNMYGTWTLDHQRMLKQFIDERFDLANKVKKANKQSIKYKQLYNGTIEKYNREKFSNEEIRSKFSDLDKTVRDMIGVIIDMGMRRNLQEKLNTLQQAIFGFATGADTVTYSLRQMSDMDKERANRYVREKDALIAELRITIQNLKRELERRGHSQVQGQLVYGNCNIHTQIIGDMQAELNQLRRYRQMYGNQGVSQTAIQSTSRTITSEQRVTGVSEADHSKLQAEFNRIKSELTRSKEEVSRLQIQIKRLRQLEIQHRGCAIRIRELEERLRVAIEQSERHQRELYELRSVKETKKTIGSINSPGRGEAMSDSYGTNYMEYVRDNSQGGNSGIRTSKAEIYQKGVFRSGGNYGVSGGESMGIGGTSGSAVGGATSLGGALGSQGYIRQGSSNYLSESRGSRMSGTGSGISGGDLSSKSSRAGGLVGLSGGQSGGTSGGISGTGGTYNYQQVYQKQYSSKGSISGGMQSSQAMVQKYSRVQNSSEQGSSSSKLYGTSTKEIIQRTVRRDQNQ